MVPRHQARLHAWERTGCINLLVSILGALVNKSNGDINRFPN